MKTVVRVAALAVFLLSTLLPHSAHADEPTTFELPGHELWGTWKVEAIEVPLLPQGVDVRTLTGWKSVLQDGGMLPVGQTVEFRYVEGGALIPGTLARGNPQGGELVQMVLQQPIQPGVCLNGDWWSRCDAGEGDSSVPPARPMMRNMIVQLNVVPRYKKLSGYWPNLAPDAYLLIGEDDAANIYVHLPLRGRDTLYFPFVIFDKTLAKDKGFDGAVVLKRIGDPPAGTPARSER